jgi:hypothetical protein
MKTVITNHSHHLRLPCIAFLAAAAIASQIGGSQAAIQPAETIPEIKMDEVPLTDAIKNLARQAGLNYIFDPRLSGAWIGAGGKPGREPSVNVHWENITAEEALSRLLKEHELTMITNTATSVARIAFTNQAVKPIPAGQSLMGTNFVIPLIVMDSVPLNDAIKHLARQAQLDVALDPALRVPSAAPVTRPLSQWEISLRWERVTAGQALAALLDNYDLVLVPDAAASSAKIVPRPPGPQSDTPPKYP